MNKLLFGREYKDEDLIDLDDDLSELFQSKVFTSLPEAKDGFKQGTFHVSIIWKDD